VSLETQRSGQPNKIRAIFDKNFEHFQQIEKKVEEVIVLVFMALITNRLRF
jgi:hypothetical protein